MCSHAVQRFPNRPLGSDCTADARHLLKNTDKCVSAHTGHLRVSGEEFNTNTMSRGSGIGYGNVLGDRVTILVSRNVPGSGF